MAKENCGKFPSLIYLMGFMGSGKSTIGPVIAEYLNYEFIDLDQYISKMTNSTIQQIFEEKGEVYFRHLESKTLIDLKVNKQTVIALGGGTPCNTKNIKLIKGTGVSIWLYVSPEETISRLSKSSGRPLIFKMKEQEKGTFITSKLLEREEYYSQADILVNGELNLEQLTLEIIEKLKLVK